MSIDSPVAILFNSDGYELASKDGYALIAANSGLLFLGSDGSNAKYIKTDSSGRITLVGAGTAGSPVGGVVSIQGVASGTNVPISGTVAATQSGTWNIDTLSTITNVVHVDDNSGSLTVDGTVAATQSGTWNINNISGTISLPTGAATAANQSTEITSLQLIDDIVHSTNATLNKAAAIAGQLDDTGTTAATEDNVAPVRITAQRAIHTNIRNASGTELATASNPLRTDPTGTTTQPVIDTQAITDNAGFTDGTSKVFMSGYIFDETAGTALTENDAAAARIDSKRAAVTVIEDANTRGRRATLDVDGYFNVDIQSWFGSHAPMVGQRSMANSIPVTFANDQSSLPIGSDNYVNNDQLYSVGVEVNMASSGADNALLYLKNPIGSGKTLYLNKINTGTSITNVAAVFKLYANPTVSADGAAATVVNRNVGGTDIHVAGATTLPTVTVLGSNKIASLSLGQNNNSVIFAENGTVAIKPGNAVLITGKPTSNNREAIISIEWREV